MYIYVYALYVRVIPCFQFCMHIYSNINHRKIRNKREMYLLNVIEICDGARNLHHHVDDGRRVADDAHYFGVGGLAVGVVGGSGSSMLDLQYINIRRLW